MDCPRCERENRTGARFCLGCGAALPVACPACRRELPADAAFCDGCGTPLGGARAASRGTPGRAGLADSAPRTYTPRHLADRILGTRGALEGERKNVTVLFADLAGSTPIAERLGAEAMHEVMDRCFQIILAEVHRFEGTVNQFAGDGAMALFGAPLALEDAPQRAVASGLRIQRALAPLAEEIRQRHGIEFGMRIGIHSGPVVVGTIGDDLRMDYTAIGDTTNLANRIEALAAPGSVFVSETTADLIEGYFDLDDVGPKQVKGKRDPIRAYRVLGERAVAGRVEASLASGLTPLCGRSAELDELEAAFRSAAAGRGQAVFVVGEAGLGKSRLVYEFRERLARRSHRWVEGRCASYARNAAFHCIADAFRRRAGIQERDDDATALEKLSGAVSGETLDWTLPYLRNLLSLPSGDEKFEALDAIERRSETFRAVQESLLAISDDAPLVLVIEDLHWIDPASEELVGFLCEAVATAPVLLVLTHRPGYQHPFGDRSFHRRLALQTLSADETESMTRTLLGAASVPQDLHALITEKAEGNPFFVEEVTKSLRETDAVRVHEGRIEMAPGVAEGSVPDRIQDVLAARLDRLDDGPKQALQTAAVIGREFALRLLERIVSQGQALGDVVEELRAVELIYQKSAHPELAYMFKHALTHDVAYESLLEQRRRALHRVVGLAIEELYADRLAEHYEALAHHFTRGEEWEKALLYSQRAEEKAIAAYANASAAEHGRQALAIAERLERPAAERATMFERLGTTLFCLNDFPGSGKAHERAAELFGEGRESALNLARAGLSYVWGHLYDDFKAVAERGLAAARKHGSVPAEVMVRVASDLYEMTTHGPSVIDDAAAETSRLARQCDDPEALAWALSQEALFAEQIGRFSHAAQIAERTLEVARELRATSAVTYPSWVLGLALGCTGQYARALETLRAGLGRCQRIGARAMVARMLNTIGWLHAEIGCAGQARGYNQVATELGSRLVEEGLVAGAPELHANGGINLAGNLLSLGEPNQAEDVLEPLRETVERPDDPWQHWRYHLHMEDARARLALARGNPELARTHVATEIEQAGRHRSPKIEARARCLEGQVLLSMDLREDAEAALRQALQIAERLEYPPVQWRAHGLLAEIGRRRGDAGGAAREAALARRLVEELAAGITDDSLQRPFRDLGERLVSDPLAACR